MEEAKTKTSRARIDEGQEEIGNHSKPAPREDRESPPSGSLLRRRWRRINPLASIRAKFLLSLLLLLTIPALVSELFSHQLLVTRLDEEINTQLIQEVKEFRSLAKGNDPETGEPFGMDVKAIFDVYFARNVPDEGEELFSIIGEEPYRSERSHDALYPLAALPDQVARWARLTDSETGVIETLSGEARYLAVPIGRGQNIQGVFVVANFPAFERSEIDDVTRVGLAVTGPVLVIACIVAWLIASRIVRPLKVLARTTRSITESDLSERIEVHGNDEAAELGLRFNEMLDRLDTAFRTQREFIDDAGHELRTPITIIRGHLELLGDDPQERRDAIAIVTDELDRMSRIVNDLLLLARAEQPDFLDLELVDMGSLTHELYTKATALAPRRWSVENTGNGMIEADRQRLTQAIMQLADNAARQTTEGDRITIGSVVVEQEARLWVRDTGPGIPPSEQERVFERFARAGIPRQRAEGAGLGLAIVRAIAEAHHGRVELQSAFGAGTTFTVVIPVSQPVVEVEEPR